MKKIISALLAIISLFMFMPNAFAAETRYTYLDLQKLYDTVVNYVFSTEDLLKEKITDEEDLFCSKSMNAAKLMLLSSERSEEEINFAYNGLYNTFSLFMLINQRGVDKTTTERQTLLKSLAGVILSDDFYLLMDEQKGNDIRNTCAATVNIISESASYDHETISRNVNTLYELLYSCVRTKIEYYYTYFNVLDFEDVIPNNWFYEAVKYVYNAGLFMGTSQNEFSPSLTMTRGMFITVLSRFAYADTEGIACDYLDVDPGSYYAGAIAWAKNNQILTWVPGNTFTPDAPITRAEMVLCMYNYSRIEGFDDSSYDMTLADKITDIEDIDEASKKAIIWGYSTGVISGYGDGTVKPYSTATRAEVSQVFINFAEVMNNY